MLVEGRNRQRKMEVVVIDNLVPEDHLLRKIDNYVDFSFINEICRPYHSADTGRPAIEPEIMFKMLFIYPNICDKTHQFWWVLSVGWPTTFQS